MKQKFEDTNRGVLFRSDNKQKPDESRLPRRGQCPRRRILAFRLDQEKQGMQVVHEFLRSG